MTPEDGPQFISGMTIQLDILAIEPFYGGARRAMMEALTRYSRHNWNLMKLPARRMDRRLAAAAQWFAEQISRQPVGRYDILFTSEAINMADFVRTMPELSKKPIIVYYHDNQLPAEGARAESPLHLVNLSTANTATEIWFNSLYHLKSFLRKATSLIEKHPELSGRNPLPKLTGMAQLMPPPIDFVLDQERLPHQLARNPKLVLVESFGCDVNALNQGLNLLERRAERIQLITIDRIDGMETEFPVEVVSSLKEEAVIKAISTAGIMLSTRNEPATDWLAIRALATGCWPIFPDSGVYPELLPPSMHSCCLYEPNSTDRMGTLIQNSWLTERPNKWDREVSKIMTRFTAEDACHAIDDRLEEIIEKGMGPKL